MGNQISKKHVLGFGSIIAGAGFVGEQLLSWIVNKLLDKINIADTPFLQEYWAQLLGLALIIIGFIFLKWWPNPAYRNNTNVSTKDGLVLVNAERHMAFDGSNKACLGFNFFTSTRLKNIKIECLIVESEQDWLFYDKVMFSGDFEGPDEKQFYPGKVWIDGSDVKYKAGNIEKTLKNGEFLLFTLRLIEKGKSPQEWSFRAEKETSKVSSLTVSQWKCGSINLLQEVGDKE